MRKFTLLHFIVVFIFSVSIQTNGQTVEFFDDFESGTTSWELTGDWGLTEDYSYSATHSMTDSPGGDYNANQDTYCTMTTGVDLSDPAILSAEVNFKVIHDIEWSTDFDWVKVQASNDDFATHTDLGIFNGENLLDPWMDTTFSLGAYVGNSNTKVRFHFHSDSGYEVDGIYIDDFTILSSDVDDAPPYIGYDNPPTFYEGSLDEFVFTTNLIDVSGIASALTYYQVEDGDWMSVAGVNTEGDTYEFSIPIQLPGDMVTFYIEATDASANTNTAVSPDYKYIAGEYMYYDDPEVAFYTNLLAGDATAVVFSLPYHTQIVTGLIRNYEDQSNPPNKNFMFHVWEALPSGPGDDIIEPFEVEPAATPSNPNPMTVVDLRDYADELTALTGDVFIGISVPEDTVKITMADPIANRSFTLIDNEWQQAAYDFHFRMITTGGGVGIENQAEVQEAAIVFPNPATDVLYIASNVGTIKSINVINTNGQVVYSEKVNGDKAQIEISNLATGIYIVQVETKKGINSQKIMVK